MRTLGSTPIASSLRASRWRCDGVLPEDDDEAVDDTVGDVRLAVLDAASRTIGELSARTFLFKGAEWRLRLRSGHLGRLLDMAMDVRV